jgi:hypothetical protein
MARKRSQPQLDISETPRPFYLVSKIPNHPENDFFIHDVVDDPGLVDTLVEGGLGNLLVWFSVIGVSICSLYYPPGYPGTSLAFAVTEPDIPDSFVGDHENHDKMGICTTVVKLAFTRESELFKAGFRELPAKISRWLMLTWMDKGTYSSAVMKPEWVKKVRPSKREKQLMAKIGADWDCNPQPKVTAALHPPANIQRDFFYWPAIPSSTNDASCREPASKRPRIGLSAGSSDEPMVYEWAGHATGGCSHYTDSSHWNIFLEA